MRKLAAAGLVVLLLAVFPANLHELTLQHAPLSSFAGRAAEQLGYLRVESPHALESVS